MCDWIKMTYILYTDTGLARISTATMEAWNTSICTRLSTACQGPSWIDVASQDDVRRADVKQEDRVKRMKPLQAAGGCTCLQDSCMPKEAGERNASFKSWEGAHECIAVRHKCSMTRSDSSDSRLLKTMLQHVSKLMSAWAWRNYNELAHGDRDQQLLPIP